MEEKKKKDIKKTAARSAVAITTAAALMTSGLFKDPAEIIRDDEITGPPPIVETIDREPVDDISDEAMSEEEEKKTPKDRLRDLLLRLPKAVRIILLMPIWCIGTAMMSVLTPLFNAVLPPLLNIVLRWALIGAILVALATAACKLIFPDIPLKKVFSKKNLIPAAVYGGLVGISGWLLNDLYPESRLLVPAVYAGAAALFIGVCLLTAAFRKGKQKTAEA